MSQQRPSSRRPTATHTTKGLKGIGKRYLHPQAAILCALVLGIAILGACGLENEAGPAPEPAATSTAPSLPVVVTYTPSPPTATNTPPPLPVETASATPTPTVTATDAAPATVAPPASDAKVTVRREMNIRSGPGTDYEVVREVVGDATAGEEFTITGKSADGEWWRIDFGGEAGWIYALYVTASNAENVPIVGSSMIETPEPTTGTETGSPDAESPVVTLLGDMNIREEPGSEYDRIGRAVAGEEFTITGKSADGEWWRIDFDEQVGWIYAPYVTASNAENVPIVGDSSTEIPVSTPVSSGAGPTPEDPVVTVGDDLMNVRDGPGTEYDRIGGATPGEKFAVTGKSSDGEWWQIDFGGQSGWLYAPYVTATNAENVPVVVPIQQPEPTATPEAQGVNSADSGRRTVIASTSDGDTLGVQFKEQ